MLIEEYLQIQPKVTFDSHIIQRVMEKYDIPEGSEAFQRDENGVEPEEWGRKRDLAEADMWEAAALTPNGGGERITVGNRSVTQPSQRLSRYDRQTFLNKARELRQKWGVVTRSLDAVELYDGTFCW